MLFHFTAAEGSLLPDVDSFRQFETQSARRERLRVSVAVASLGFAALILLGILGRVLRPFVSGELDALANAQQCMAVADSQLRLDCYDRQARIADPWPAKGARAPQLFQTSKGASQLR